MTTTTTFKGVDPNSRNSSRVLRPPGGGSNFSLGFDEPTEQPVRKNKMASNIFGTPEENQASWAKSAGAKSSGGREDLESSGLQRRNSSEASSGDFLDLKGEGDIHATQKKTPVTKCWGVSPHTPISGHQLGVLQSSFYTLYQKITSDSTG
ncbi:jupiter microtubule associated homolog 1 isoform X2 [Piliocolobus tephrosceles]|uniref:jupiter microtubule associated homolog 1 isoform X2 n=1 Tax=Piliocolobus tephrosceles TaxID=591936 RepID=UPI000C2B32C8|nr:jupiter microtubule associated homolog 1 isoform X2 [Piliocolobus tephrosceles]